MCSLGRSRYGQSDFLQLSVTGVLATFYFLVKLETGAQAVPSVTDSKIDLCLWILKLLTAFGLSFVKLSIAFSLLRVVVSKHLKQAIRGIIGRYILFSARS